MSRFLVVLLALATHALSVPQRSKPLSGDGCLLDLLANYPYAPLVINSDLKFPNPIALDDIRLAFTPNETFYIGCPGGRFNYSMIYPSGIPATCYEGDAISILNDWNISFTDLSCTLDETERPHIVELYPSGYCENLGTIVNIGYAINEKFALVISTCFGPDNLSTLYSKYVTTPWSRTLSGEASTAQNVYVPELFDNIDMFSVYRNLKEIVEGLGVHGYITNDIYLEKAYLAPDEDFFTLFERDATLDLVNTAARWNTLSDGNWRSVEDSIRKLVQGETIGDATIISGTLGVATLPDNDGTPVDLYLADGKIPVPRWFWKIMYSPLRQHGVIVFSFNNPYVAKPVVDREFNSTICTENIIHEETWISGIDNVDPLSGFTYVCDLKLSSITNALIFNIVDNLLTNTDDLVREMGTIVVSVKEQDNQNNEDSKSYI